MPVAKEEYLVPKHNYRVVALEYANVIASSSSNANVLKTWVCTIYLAYASTSRNSKQHFQSCHKKLHFESLGRWKIIYAFLVVVFCLDDGEQWRFKNSLSSHDFKLGFGGAT